jgi:hypothetical protein
MLMLRIFTGRLLRVPLRLIPYGGRAHGTCGRRRLSDRLHGVLHLHRGTAGLWHGTAVRRRHGRPVIIHRCRALFGTAGRRIRPVGRSRGRRRRSMSNRSRWHLPVHGRIVITIIVWPRSIVICLVVAGPRSIIIGRRVVIGRPYGRGRRTIAIRNGSIRSGSCGCISRRICRPAGRRRLCVVQRSERVKVLHSRRPYSCIIIPDGRAIDG